MKELKPIVSLLVMSLSYSIMGCSTNLESKSTRALFDTKEEAAKASKEFNCTGAHQMGDKWMSCKSHDAPAEIEKHGGHHHH